jgi:cytosolic carboxypeptidase protein 1
LTFSNQSIQSKGIKKKKVIYITARVHAGETHSSLIMSKILRELSLCQDGEKYKYEQIFQNYVIKLVPMLNPDGVTIGNSRTSIIGLDLNRRWTQPNPIIHPEVYFLK